ncbi:MAG: acyl-CoA mutase large subunit family protein [Bacteroidales bacterium]|nr:acyl-CoA mutase large subunit family protein [Bacteroidales bacterium]
MSDNKNINRLFNEFPPVSTKDWETKINQDLKGADYEKKLVWKTLEDINVKPYYRSEDLENLKHLEFFPGDFPFIRGNKTDNNDWYIRQDIIVDNANDANKKALKILNRGVNSIGFVFNNFETFSKNDFNKLLNDIHINSIEINFIAGHYSVEILRWLIEKIKNEKLNPDEIIGSVDFDTIGVLTLKGNFCKSDEFSFNYAKELIEIGKELPNFKNIVIHGDYFHNSGSSIVQELGFSLAVGCEYLYQLTKRGISIDDIAPKFKFQFAVGSNYFMEIAKLRAARMLWAKIIECFSPCCQEKAKMNIHCETSQWNKTIYDPYVNMLRSTTESMSAALAGTDSLTVLPFDKAYSEPSDFSERIARNTQIVLKEEAYFNKVIDPSAGSYYIEKLTDSIVEQSWKLFCEVEENGGYVEAFKKGFIQNEIKKITQKRDLNIATRKEIFLGTNQFPNFDETLKIEIPDSVIIPKSAKAENAITEPLIPYRGTQAFEILRQKTEKSGKRPKTFMFTYGNLAMRKARATFSCNFFACAGFEVVDNSGFKTIDEGIKASIDNKADIVVICSSDDEYKEIVPEIYNKLKDKAIIVVAGYPKNIVDELKSKGIKNFIHVKSNILETLSDLQKQLGIK